MSIWGSIWKGMGTDGGNSQYPSVETYNDLPQPPSAYTDKIFVVLKGSGLYVFNRKSAGMYRSDGTKWYRLGNIPAYFDDLNFEVFNHDSNTKRVSIDSSNLSAPSKRQIIMADHNVELKEVLPNTIHRDLINNPHSVTKDQVGLANVDNTSDINKPISNDTQTALNNKVDKISGKGLSTEDYTTVEKNKLSNIEAGAEVNIQSDWNESDTDKDDYIKNVPSEFPPSPHTHDDRYYTESEMDYKLSHIQHSDTLNLGNDDHIQYFYSQGRNGGQSLNGGVAANENLIVSSNSSTTKGKVILGNIYFHEALNGISINSNALQSGYKLDVNGKTWNRDEINGRKAILRKGIMYAFYSSHQNNIVDTEKQLQLNTNVIIDDTYYSRNNGDITIKTPGLYKIDFTSSFIDTDWNRVVMESYLKINGNKIPQSSAFCYVRNDNNSGNRGTNNCSLFIPINSANSLLQLFAIADDDSGGTCSTINNTTSISIEKVSDL